jgi:hypothetical protein
MPPTTKPACVLAIILALASTMFAQGTDPYPHAITTRGIITETAMKPPAKNVVFTDPDFGSSMVRATDSNTNFKLPGTFLHTEASGQANEWSSDSKKFYVIGKGGRVLALAFNPKTMHISSLPNAGSGKALLLPMLAGPSFAFTDPDLIYGSSNQNSLIIITYRFSTNSTTPVIDTRNCGVQPPLGTGRSVRADEDVTLSLDDNRVSISEGGPEGGEELFVVVYDKALGCRWYNTQTRQIGGAWGASGYASTEDSYFIRHAYLSRSGQYVRILTKRFGMVYLGSRHADSVTLLPRLETRLRGLRRRWL